MKPTPGSAQKSLGRVLLIARFDGMSVLAVAGGLGLLSAAFGDYFSATVGALVAGAGAAELHGTRLLARRDQRGMDWLVRSQLALLIAILGYCAFRLLRPELAPLRALISADMREQLEVLGLSVDHFLGLLYRLVYGCVALTTLLYQGGLAIYYSRRRRIVAQALAES